MSPALFSSRSDDYGTPLDLFNRLNAIFQFTLDPCASPTNAKCQRYYTEADDGLTHSWDGERVFMNPPYGRSISHWVKKAADAHALVVCLLPVRTDTHWWQQHIVGRGAHVVFIDGRVRFRSGDTSTDRSGVAPFPSALVMFTGGALAAPRSGRGWTSADRLAE